MELELKSDQERDTYLRDLSDSILHLATEDLPGVKMEDLVEDIPHDVHSSLLEEDAPASTLAEDQRVISCEHSMEILSESPVESSTAPTIKSYVEAVQAYDPPLVDEAPIHTRESSLEVEEEVAPDRLPPEPITPQPIEPEPSVSEPQPNLQDKTAPTIKQPAPLEPPVEEPTAVQRTKRWSRGMFAALTSRNDKP